jgi:hypothetical protein
MQVIRVRYLARSKAGSEQTEDQEHRISDRSEDELNREMFREDMRHEFILGIRWKISQRIEGNIKKQQS